MRRKRFGEAFAGTFAGSGYNAKADAASGTIAVTPKDSAAPPAVFSLDQQGFVGGIRTPLGREWRIASDDAGRATSITNPGGSTAHFGYDKRGRLTQVGRDGGWLLAMEHDTANNLRQVSYADGTRETLTYQNYKKLTNVSRRSQIGQSFEYDKRDCLAALVDGKGNRTRYEYGEWSLPARAIFADGSKEEYEYDERGYVKAITRGGVRADVRADEQGRLCELKYPSGATVERSYTADGLLGAVKAGGSETRWEYKEGRVTREQGVTGAAEYLYSESGQLVGLVYPDGSRVAYRWDDDGRLAGITDWSGAETKWHYASEDRGWVTEYASGLRAGTRVAPTGLTQEIFVKPPMLGGGWRATYTHDAEDRVSASEDSLGGRREFQYDADGRLVRAGEQAYRYDDADNLIQGGFGGAAFNAANQPMGVVGGVACGSDARGNLTLGLAQGGLWEFVWDEQNRLVEARGPRGQKIEYGYDGLGRRAWRKEGARYSEYFWAGETQIGETETVGGEVVRRQEYLFIPGTYTLFAVRVNGRVLYAHCDPVGTPRLLTDAKGESVWGASYDAWGVTEKVWGGDAVQQPWRFPGQYADATTGLCDNRFRVYNPYLGRYLSRDLLGYAGGGLNLYAYAGNDPVNGADPLGLWSWSGVAVAVASIAVGVAVTALLAPVAPFALAVIAGGMVAGALGFGVNEALNEKEFCATCVALAALKGAVIGGVAAIPFAIAGPAAGLGAIVAAGGASGGLGYVGTWALTPGMKFSWADFGKSVALGAATAGAFKLLAPMAGKVWAGVKGADVAPTGEPEPVDLKLKYKDGWSDAQRAEADAKVNVLNDSDCTVTKPQRSGTSASSRYKKAGGDVPSGSDVDHKVDLQLGGSDTVDNMWPLNSSVNRSLGAQIQNQIKDLPAGTPIGNVTISD